MTSLSPAALTATSLATSGNNLPWVPTFNSRRRRAVDARLARAHALRDPSAAGA
jgi:hypothetical protein